MFQNSIYIDNRLSEDVTRIEAKVPGYRVLGAEYYLSSIKRFSINCSVRFPRKLTLIEEFVLRGAMEFTDSGLTWVELAQVLSVDKRFVFSTVSGLLKLDALQYPSSGAGDLHTDFHLKVTRKGEEFYSKQQIPHKESRQVSLFYDSATGSFVSVGKFDSWEKIVPRNTRPPRTVNMFPSIIPNPENRISHQLLISVTRNSGYPLENEVEDRRLESFDIIGIDNENALLALYLIWDVVDEKLFLRIENKTLQIINDYDEEALESWIKRADISLEDLIQPSNDDFDNIPISFVEKRSRPPSESRLSLVEPLIGKSLRQAREGAKASSTKNSFEKAILIPDQNIREMFLNSLKQAQKGVIIVTPWIADKSVDETFLKLIEDLASKSVITILGWGFSNRIETEGKKPSPDIIDRLHKLKTPQGFQAVSVVWLGDQHSKDVIVDTSLHLYGSFEWLSYRGVYIPCGETVYSITFPESIHSAIEYIGSLFLLRADEAWNTYMESLDNSIPYHLVTIYVALGHLTKLISYLPRNAKQYQSQFSIFKYLIDTISPQVGGLTSENIVELLERLGALLDKPLISVSQDDSIILRKGIMRLVQEMRDIDSDTIFKVFSTYSSGWRSIDLITSDETVEDFVRNWAQNSPRDIKDRHDKTRRRKGNH